MSLVGRKYAIALFDVATDKNILEDVYQDFSGFIEVIDGNHKFSELLMVPSIGSDEKKSILKNVFKDELNLYLKNFLNILIDKNRFENVREIYADFRRKYFEHQNMVEATVLTVHPIDSELEETLKVNLEKRFDKKIHLSNKIDPSILGGAVVYVGEQVIDGSVRKQLDEIKSNMNNIRLH
ncbi:F0F1 ATP synthase subunit delta [Eubacteriaceae bacterium ES2]|nr:F0F1 ATP synthase subunit delta [Eubacteriaceae bacterium ES2]